MSNKFNETIEQLKGIKMTEAEKSAMLGNLQAHMRYNPIRAVSHAASKSPFSVFAISKYATLMAAVLIVIFGAGKLKQDKITPMPFSPTENLVTTNTEVSPSGFAKETARTTTTTEQPTIQSTMIAVQPKEPEPTPKTTAPSTTTYAAVVTFSSYNGNINIRAVASYDAYITSIEERFPGKITKTKSAWGKNGEFDYCVQLTGLDQNTQTEILQNLKTRSEGKELVELQFDAECHNPLE